MDTPTYGGRTTNLTLFLLLFLTWLFGLPLLLVNFVDISKATRLHLFLGLGGAVASLLMIIAGGQQAAVFTVLPEHFLVQSMNYLTRIKKTRRVSWGEISSVDYVNLGHHINSSGSDIGGSYLVILLKDGSTIRVIGNGGDYDGSELAEFKAAIEHKLSSTAH